MHVCSQQHTVARIVALTVIARIWDQVCGFENRLNFAPCYYAPASVTAHNGLSELGLTLTPLDLPHEGLPADLDLAATSFI
jgi:hypothetical protein